MTGTTSSQDVVDLLRTQHDEIKRLLARVRTATGEARRDAFQQLVRLLAVHESAEELLVHPAARESAGDSVVAARRHEEYEAKHILSELYDLGMQAPMFDRRFEEFERAVLAHATHEETEEFPPLRRHTDVERLRRMADVIQAADAVPATRPHPGTGESAMANLLAGPPAAVFDWMRAALRDWRQSHNL
jgi:hemerythrin superfamily protein